MYSVHCQYVVCNCYTCNVVHCTDNVHGPLGLNALRLHSGNGANVVQKCKNCKYLCPGVSQNIPAMLLKYRQQQLSFSSLVAFRQLFSLIFYFASSHYSEFSLLHISLVDSYSISLLNSRSLTPPGSRYFLAVIFVGPES
jgi:hypothetical protein